MTRSQRSASVDRRLRQTLSAAPIPEIRSGFRGRLRHAMATDGELRAHRRVGLWMTLYGLLSAAGSIWIVWRLRHLLSAGVGWPLIAGGAVTLSLAAGLLIWLLSADVARPPLSPRRSTSALGGAASYD